MKLLGKPMKRFSRILAVATLGVYLGLAVTESFHHHAQGQTESHCPICQVVHQTPVISQGRPINIRNPENFLRVVSHNAPPILAETEKVSLGRSPPSA